MSRPTRLKKPKSSNTRKKEKKSDASADVISFVPKELIYHILSFLDMKEVVQTSLLSRGWRDIWKSVSVLNFDYSLWKHSSIKKRNAGQFVKKVIRKDECVNFVNGVLFLRDTSVNIRKINLSHYYCRDSHQLDIWLLLFASKVLMKELYLETVSENRPYILPHSLFTSKIEVFKLNSSRGFFDDGVAPQLPESVLSACHLTTLELESAQLPKGNSDGELVLKNEKLESLILKNCGHHNLKILNITAPQLKKLVIANTWRNSKSVRSCEIKLCTPNLTSLQVYGECYKDCSLGNLSCLVIAKIGDYSNARQTTHLTKMLDGLRNVSTLEVRSSHKILSDSLDELVSPFSKLSCLKLAGPSCIGTIAKFLESAPSIETLVLEKVSKEFEEKIWGKELSFGDIFHHLRCVELLNLECSKNELKLLRFLLENGIALKNVTVTYDKWSADLRKEELQEFLTMLDSLPGASSIVCSYMSSD